MGQSEAWTTVERAALSRLVADRDRYRKALEQIRCDVLDTEGEKAVLIANEALRDA